MESVHFITEGPLVQWQVGPFRMVVTTPMIVGTFVTIILCLFFIWLGRNLEPVPKSKKQILAETLYTGVEGIVDDNMGKQYRSFVPFIGGLLVFLIAQNLVGLVGLKPGTSSLSTTLGLGISAFVIIHGHAIAKGGMKGYLKSYLHPMPALFPITLMERLILPISLALRLYGNILAATVIMSLIYGGLMGVNTLAAGIIPIPFHMYFDIFDGTIQAVIFTFLTMIQIKLVAADATGEEP